MSLSEDIKDFALDLGYSRVGITTAEPFPEYIANLKARHEMYSFYIDHPTQPLKGAEPRSVMPSAKSIVMVVFDAFKESFPEKLVGKIGRIYQARLAIYSGKGSAVVIPTRLLPGPFPSH